MPTQGLPQGCCPWRQAPLRGARRRKAMPAHGLPQGCSKRRYAALHGAWRRQALSEGGLLPTSLCSRERLLRVMSTGHVVGRNHNSPARLCSKPRHTTMSQYKGCGRSGSLQTVRTSVHASHSYVYRMASRSTPCTLTSVGHKASACRRYTGLGTGMRARFKIHSLFVLM